MYNKKYHIHFVGIGGIGMSGIAELLLNLDYSVSGSDLRPSDLTRRLALLGGTIYEGHAAENITDADVVVVSSAINRKNPEIQAAEKKGIPIIPRAEMLAELMRLKYSIAVAGAHGKTTTTSIVAAILGEAKLDPTVIVGGKLLSVGVNAVLGKGDYLVAEADESDGSFLNFTPSIAVVTNIDREHLDFYGDLEAIRNVFLSFIERIPFYGLAVLCMDNENVQAIIPKVKKRFVTYGVSHHADFRIANIHTENMRSRFSVSHDRHELGEVELNLPGLHNVYNATAAIAVALELNVDFADIKRALANLKGVHRRLEIKGTALGVTVVDDYGHHPTEIKATLDALNVGFPEKQKVVVFQPHRYSRTRALVDGFATAFFACDTLIVTPIYAAGEENVYGISSEKLCDTISEHGHKDVRCAASLNQALEMAREAVGDDALLLTLGAGDVWRVGMQYLEKTQEV